MNTLDNNFSIDKILSLFHDPLFADFELQQESPTIFNAVGRTHTETWHSALLGWLLNPASSHNLGTFALKRFLLMLKTIQQTNNQDHLSALLAQGDFSQTQVRPNERDLSEVSVPNTGSFDVYVDGIQNEHGNKVHILIEMKVKALIDKTQCNKYIQYIDVQQKSGVLILPVFIAPSSSLTGTSEQLFGDNSWIKVSFQELYDEVIEPCLKYPVISDFGKFTIIEYSKTLKRRHKGDEVLAITQKDEEIVEALFNTHEQAIRSLYTILSERQSDISALPINSPSNKNQINIVDNTGTKTLISESSIRRLYIATLEYLDKGDYLSGLVLPIPSGTRRYLLATNDEDQNGDAMLNPAHYQDKNQNNLYMEANKSRSQGLQDLTKLLDKCGLKLEVVN